MAVRVGAAVVRFTASGAVGDAGAGVDLIGLPPGAGHRSRCEVCHPVARSHTTVSRSLRRKGRM